MTGTTNVNELLEILDISETILRFNSELESDIVGNGGSILYSYNNIIIASEISEEYYTELSKSPYINYIQDIPLKKFGEINNSLIDQLDISKLFLNENVTTINTTINSVNITTNNLDISSDSTVKVSGTEIVYGKTKKEKIINLSGDTSSTNNLGIAPKITNNDFILNIEINENFSYNITANGSLPIKYEYIKPKNYTGNIDLQYGNTITGKTNNSGIYNIQIKAINNFGYDIKTLTLNVYEHVKITNTNLNVYNKIGSQFSYLIESTGNLQKTYSVINLPIGLTLNNNIISGLFTTAGVFNMTINVSGITNSDSKILTVNSGYAPVITSSGVIICKQYSGLTYYITPESNDYNIIGILPEGLKFSGNIIQGTPIYDGITQLKIRAINPYGESIKDLKITITSI